ncbi:MAG: FKBP-type peptidyl-prolyl cis-trans isomerase [bacterium]|nr:FKBP-type peptidyl-prolyl cis-trans isomerase [bacterium]
MANKKLQTGTTKGQRVAIWAILILTIGSTIALYFSMFLGQKNQIAEHKAYQENQKKYQDDYKKYQDKLDQQAKKLSDIYYAEFSQYKNRVAAFNSTDAEKAGVKTEDLKVGSGAEINYSSIKYTAYYIGWKPDGTVFDGSIDGEKLKNPLFVEKQGDKWQMIEGWTEGVKGMKVGGIREISIPSAKAYGQAGSPNQTDPAKSIAPSESIRFVVMIIPDTEAITPPNPADYGLGA